MIILVLLSIYEHMRHRAISEASPSPVRALDPLPDHLRTLQLLADTASSPVDNQYIPVCRGSIHSLEIQKCSRLLASFYVSYLCRPLPPRIVFGGGVRRLSDHLMDCILVTARCAVGFLPSDPKHLFVVCRGTASEMERASEHPQDATGRRSNAEGVLRGVLRGVSTESERIRCALKCWMGTRCERVVCVTVCGHSSGGMSCIPTAMFFCRELPSAIVNVVCFSTPGFRSNDVGFRDECAPISCSVHYRHPEDAFIRAVADFGYPVGIDDISASLECKDSSADETLFSRHMRPILRTPEFSVHGVAKSRVTLSK